MSMLAGLAVQNGHGKGACGDWEPTNSCDPMAATAPAAVPARDGNSIPMATSEPVVAEVPAVGAPPSPAFIPADAPLTDTAVEDDVDRLLEMGLITDRGVAAELLRGQEGDVKKVIAMLVG